MGKHLDIKKGNNGFTLLEVIIAIFILTSGIIGVLSLLTQTISLGPEISSRLIAAYLAQEGIEITRNIRDTNWLEQTTNPSLAWDEGLTDTITCPSPPCDFEADYDDQSLTTFTGGYLNFDGSFYSSSVNPAKFSRKITLSQDDHNSDGTKEIKVTVQVDWQEKGRQRSLTAQEYLFNWR